MSESGWVFVKLYFYHTVLTLVDRSFELDLTLEITSGLYR